MRISSHAIFRYSEYVGKCYNAYRELKNMWRMGRPADKYDFIAYRASRLLGYQYIIGKGPNGIDYLLVMQKNTIVTIIEPR